PVPRQPGAETAGVGYTHLDSAPHEERAVGIETRCLVEAPGRVGRRLVGGCRRALGQGDGLRPDTDERAPRHQLVARRELAVEDLETLALADRAHAGVQAAHREGAYEVGRVAH